MKKRVLIAAGACAFLVGFAGAATCATPGTTNACACAAAKAATAKRPAPPLTLKLEQGVSDADVVTFKAAVLARIDEAVKKAKAENAENAGRPVTIRLVVNDGRNGPPPHGGWRFGKGRGFKHARGERPEPPHGEPPHGEPPPDRPDEP